MSIICQTHTTIEYKLSRYQPQIFLADEDDIPLSIPLVDGRYIVGDCGQRESAALHAKWAVPAFGEITLSTGMLKPSADIYNLNVEMAKERLAKVSSAESRWSREGFKPGTEYHALMAKARWILKHVAETERESVNARWADLSLRESVKAGEVLALGYADFGIDKRRTNGDFDSFFLGCNFFQYPDCDPEYTERFKEAFNFATLPFYWGRIEPRRGHPLWENIDPKLDWLDSQGITAKGHPLMWYQQLPDWIDPENQPVLHDMLGRRIDEIVSRYKGRIRFWDIVNELQRIEDQENAEALTRLASEAVISANPDAIRIVNCDDPFAEYLAHSPREGVHPLEFFRRLLDHGVDFEVIGVQVYHGGAWTYARDLFEMSRYFDRYGELGKELHLSELGVPSEEGLDPNDFSAHNTNRFDGSYRWKASDAGYWHGPWDQNNQADWVEGFYKVLMGKPFVKAITWWDLSDAYRHFFTHAGLLDSSNEPKESFRRIVELRKRAGL